MAIVNSVFSGNSAAAAGGALGNFSSGVLGLTNTVIEGGHAFGAGAILNNAALTAVNCTIVSNSAASQAGGISSQGGRVTLLNTILWRNALAPSSGPQATLENQQIYTFVGGVTATNSVIQGLYLYSGDGNTASDPLFEDFGAGNYRLSAYSPAINSGSNDFNTLAADADGQPRVQLGTIDQGAYESPTAQGSPVALLVTPASTTVCANSIATFTVQSQGAQNYGWQYFDGASWQDFTYDSGSAAWIGPALGSYQISSNAATSSLVVSDVAEDMSGYQYRFVIPDIYTGSAATLTVAPPTVIYVNARAGSGGNGQSWGAAYKDLQVAMSVAQDCRNEIWVAAGTYTPTTGTDTSINYNIVAGLSLYGGFNGTETNRAQRDWLANPTILSGAIGGVGQATASSSEVVNFDGFNSAVGRDTLLDGFTVRGGQTGVLCFHASPTIRNCQIQGNAQSGVQTSGASPLLQIARLLGTRPAIMAAA